MRVTKVALMSSMKCRTAHTLDMRVVTRHHTPCKGVVNTFKLFGTLQQYLDIFGSPQQLMYLHRGCIHSRGLAECFDI